MYSFKVWSVLFISILLVFPKLSRSMPSSEELNGVVVEAEESSMPYFDMVNDDDSDDDTLFVFNEELIPGLNDNNDQQLEKFKEQVENKLMNKNRQAVSHLHKDEGEDTGNRNFWEWIQQFLGVATSTQKPVLDKPENCEPCQCGIVNHKRIVNGQETDVNEYPWMTLLMYNNKFYCGGSLINDRYIMTAAHCTSGLTPEKISAVLLEHDRSSPNETQTIKRSVTRVVRHPRYSNRNYNNDIALLRLNEPVPLKSPLRPVCMPTRGKSFSDMQGIVTGWGATSEGGSVATKLQEVTVPIMSNAKCMTTDYKDRITDNMMCAGLPEGMKDSCQGDSGGPMHIANATNNNIHQVVGIVSWGEGCAQANKPGVYTRVNRYLTWIKSNTEDACYC